MKRSLLALALFGGTAQAQPAPEPVPPPAPAPGPLAKIADEKQLAITLSQIVQDPAVPVEDPERRKVAQALMAEGVKRVLAHEYEQGLANFLEAYAKFPSPRVLLNIGSTLDEMGRLSDAANTYQRFLLDPLTTPEYVAEVKDLLIDLDKRLTILTIRVNPPGSSLSIDAGPFIPVGNSLQARVRPGIHLVRIKHGELTNEQTVNGFEGELKEVEMKILEPIPLKPDPGGVPQPAPAVVNAWLDDSQRYGSKAGASNERTVYSAPNGSVITAYIPPRRDDLDDDVVIVKPARESIHSGVLAVMRIDGEGRGVAGGLGIAFARGRFEADLMVLRSNETGAYLGGRYRLLTGFFRPYVAAGVPGFVFDKMTGETSETKVSLGLRGAGGLELYINGHLSVQADVGYEHFWFLSGTNYDNSIVIPTIGVIGRL